MVKVYIPNTSNTLIGGGFTFNKNIREALKDKVQFVDNWQDCDILFAFGITTMDKTEAYEAINAGKKFVLRVDNIPRKSRNKRQSPAERLKEFGKIADKVIYQSNWAKEYAGYFSGEGKDGSVVIYNGVDTSIFNKEGRNSDGKTYLYANYNDNPNKRFDEALYRFDMLWRADNNRHLLIAGNVPRIYLEHPEYNWDIPTLARVEYVGIMQTLEEMADLYRRCDYLIYPSFAEACPNVVLEAMACGVVPKHLNYEGGSLEVYSNCLTDKTNPENYKIRTIQEMGQEYLKIFEEICQKK